MGGRISHIDAVREHADGRSACGKCTAMRRDIDAEGTTDSTVTPCSTRSAARSAAMPLPYAVAAREPTIATDRSIR